MTGGIRHWHIERDAVNGEAHIRDGSIPYTKLKSDTIYLRCTLTQIETKTGLAADSTGVKATSPRAKVSARHLRKLVVRAKVDAIPSDATVRVEVYDVTKDTVLGYVEFAGATGEKETEITSGWGDGDLLELRANVTTASGTSGATFDLGYAILEAEYGIS